QNKQAFSENKKSCFPFSNNRMEKIKKLILTYCLFVAVINDIPFDQIPESCYVIGTAVLVFEVISMFPNINSQNGRAGTFGYIHQRVILVGRGANTQFIVFIHA